MFLRSSEQPTTSEARKQSPEEIGGLLARCEAQETLFAERVSRLALQNVELAAAGLKSYRVNVWRNHNFESVESLQQPFLAYAGLSIEYHLRPYDDSLDFRSWDKADVELLWIDSTRYLDRMTSSDWEKWLKGRISELRVKTSAPIIVATWNAWDPKDGLSLTSLAEGFAGAFIGDMFATCEEEKVVLLDQRVAKVTGSPISRQAQVVLARRLGCLWLPAVLLPPIKAVAVDLDNTLYRGVLGEDGAGAIVCEQGHLTLQSDLLALRERGVFLALVSRNEREDVINLFRRRTDFPLKWEDFSATEVSWGSKSAALSRIAEKLRIGSDAILFVDDNPGELMEVALGCSGIHALFASSDGEQTARGLRFYPALWRWKLSADDTRRVADHKANAARAAAMRASSTEEQYFRELAVTLTIRYDDVSDSQRLGDLSGKTNQFNLAMRRYNQVNIGALMENELVNVASVSLSDRLSDSGTIALVVAKRVGNDLIVDELCVSCRALGRRLEDTIVLAALRSMPIFDGCSRVRFENVEGARNQPARAWLEHLTGKTSGAGRTSNTISADAVRGFILAPGVKLIHG